MTEQDPTTGVPPTNIQIYEKNPDSLEGAALDRQGGRRLPFILAGVLVVLLLVALVRRRRAAS